MEKNASFSIGAQKNHAKMVGPALLKMTILHAIAQKDILGTYAKSTLVMGVVKTAVALANAKYPGAHSNAIAMMVVMDHCANLTTLASRKTAASTKFAFLINMKMLYAFLAHLGLETRIAA